MDKKRPIETEQDLVNALEDFAYDVTEDESIKDIDEELNSLGYAPSEIGRKFQIIASQALAASPLDWRNRARADVTKAREKLNKAYRPDLTKLDKPSLVEAVQLVLKKLGYNDPALVPAQYRNFEQATENDLISLLQHLEYLSSNDNHGEES